MGMFYIGDGVGKNIIYPTFFSGFCPVLIVARPDSAWRENLTAPHPKSPTDAYYRSHDILTVFIAMFGPSSNQKITFYWL